MKKRPYRALRVNNLDSTRVAALLEGHDVIVGIDIAKVDMVAAIADRELGTVLTIKWKHPNESPQFFALLEELASSSAKLTVAMESTGTYGDALRYHLLQREIHVEQVSALRVKRSVEIHDGVPSSHDGKCASVIVKLCRDKAGTAWPILDADERQLKAMVKKYNLYQGQYLQNINRLEAELARHWPELTACLPLDRVSLWHLLLEVGGPSEVAADRTRAAKVLRKIGGHFLEEARVVEILDTAEGSLGVPMDASELDWLQELCRDIIRSYHAYQQAEKEVSQARTWSTSISAMADVVGGTTAAVLVAESGNPNRYGSAAAYEKAVGLNLRECSSGKHKGQLRITKRGSGRSRQLLFLAVLRMKQNNADVQAWFEARSERSRGWKMRAIVAMMRKLVKALWHIAGGAAFENNKLIDLNRLQKAV